MVTKHAWALLALWWVSADAAAQGLQHEAEAFAGVPVAVDPRLAGRVCAGGYLLAWAPGGLPALDASCAADGWRARLPLKQSRVAVPRRGEPVRVEIAGEGFRLAVAGKADGVDAAGRLRVRRADGRHFLAGMDATGRLTLVPPVEERR